MNLKEKLEVIKNYDDQDPHETFMTIADDYAIEFAEWCCTLINRVGLLKYKSEYMNKSTKELLEIFKKEKGL